MIPVILISHPFPPDLLCPTPSILDLSASAAFDPPLVSVTLLLAHSIGGIACPQPLKDLPDSGSDKTILHSRCLLPGMVP
jgi:hypothetical protein